jgi:outer membrane biogenesis lipoprotein LolB
MGNISEPSATLTGWQADISQWQTLNDRTIPKALMLSHGDEYRIKILITSWRPLSATEAL